MQISNITRFRGRNKARESTMRRCGLSQVRERNLSCGLTFTNSSITGSLSAFTPFCGTDSDMVAAAALKFLLTKMSFPRYHARLSSYPPPPFFAHSIPKTPFSSLQVLQSKADQSSGAFQTTEMFPGYTRTADPSQDLSAGWVVMVTRTA